MHNSPSTNPTGEATSALDDPNQVQTVQKIRFEAQEISGVVSGSRETMFVRNCPSGESNAA
jgi:hypothetical protein